MRPLDFDFALPKVGTVTHVANFSDFVKLLAACGPGMEGVEEAYARRIADMVDMVDMVDPKKIYRAYNETIDPMIEDAMVRCLEEQPDLVPEECKHRMVLVRGRNRRAIGGAGGVTFQCGESAILPLEIAIRPLTLADETPSSRGGGTHMATYSNLDKLLDECGPGAQRAQDLAFQSDDDLWDAFGRIVDDSLVKCLEKRNLIPEACRQRMTPLHNSPRSFKPKVRYRCGGAATDALLE